MTPIPADSIPKWRGDRPLAGLAVLVVAFLVVALTGVDFGHHWDEPYLMQSVATSAETGRLLPLTYNYPSGAYWLAVIASLPDWGDPSALTGDAALIRVRVAFIGLYALGLVLTFMLTATLTERRWVALLAATLLAGSWEYGYHARWVAPEGVVIVTALTTVYLSVQALKTERRAWLYAAAIAGGFTVGSKYNAGLFALTVPLSAGWLIFRDGAGRKGFRFLRLCGVLALIGLASFLLTTPGVLLDTAQFLDNVREEITHYSQMGHHNHTVTPGFEHLGLNLLYLGAVTFSPASALLAWIVALISAFGLILTAAGKIPRVRPALASVVWVLPLVYLLYMSLQRVMIVRNLMILLPFMAIFAALGVHAVVTWRRQAGYAAAGMLGIIALSGLAWGFNAAQTVAERGSLPDDAADVRAYIADHPDTTFCVSSALSADFSANTFGAPNLRYFERVDYVIYASEEVYSLGVQANRPDLYRVFGAREVNWDYYPDWAGDPRYVMIDGDQMAERGVAIGNCIVGE